MWGAAGRPRGTRRSRRWCPHGNACPGRGAACEWAADYAAGSSASITPKAWLRWELGQTFAGSLYQNSGIDLKFRETSLRAGFPLNNLTSSEP